jgi:hypothetical protein
LSGIFITLDSPTLSCGMSPYPEISLEESTMMVLEVSEMYLAISLIMLVFPVPNGI